MKHVSTILLVSALAGAGACASFDPERPVVVAPDRRVGLDALEPVLDELFRSGKPVVLYVHGRGNEPKKSIRKGILRRIELQYDVKVLMLDWESKAPFFVFGRPVDKAIAAAPRLGAVVERLAAYRQSHAAARSVPLSLLAHSMGTIVLEEAVTRGHTSLRDAAGRPVFSNILLTQSDSDAGPHAGWVGRLPASGTVLLTLNRKDLVLARSKHRNGDGPLGISDPKDLALADTAFYLDLTDLVGGHHRLFAKGGQDDNVAVCQIMTEMLGGKAEVNLKVGETIGRIDRGRVLTPLPDTDETPPCFRGVAKISEAEELADPD